MATKKIAENMCAAAIFAVCVVLLCGAVMMVAKSFASNQAWHEVRAERQAYWAAMVEAAPMGQRGTMLFIRSKVERKICVGGRDLEWSTLDLAQTKSGVLQRERDCLAVLREEVALTRQEEKITMIDQITSKLN